MQTSEMQYRKYLQMILRRKELFVLVALLIITAVFAVSFLLPRKYEASTTVYIEKHMISEMVKGITVTTSREDSIEALTYALTSRSLVTKASQNIDLLHGSGDAAAVVGQLQQSIEIKVKDGNLFTISFIHSNPRVARDFLNTLVALCIEQNSSSKRAGFYDANRFLTEQIDSYNAKMQKAGDEINAYKRDQGGVIAIDEGKLFEEINSAQQKLSDLQLRRRQLEGMRQVTRKVNDPLQAKLAVLQKRLEDLRVQYTDSFPEVAGVKGDIETVKELLKQRKPNEYQALAPQELAKIDAEVDAIRMTETGLRRYIASNKEMLQRIPAAKAGLEKLELEKNNQKQIYDQLVSRHGQSEVSTQMEVQDKATTFRVVDPALLPVKPVSPNRLQIMLLGIVGGLAAAYALIMLLDQLDSSVKGVEFVKGLGAPVLAVIPRMQDPLLEARKRRRAWQVFSIAGVYLLVLLAFPAMEFLGLGYMDRLLDNLQSAKELQSDGKLPHQQGLER